MAMMADEDDKLYPGAGDEDDFKDDNQYEEHEDGSVTVHHKTEEPAADNDKFYGELSAKIDQAWLSAITTEYIELVEQDIKDNEDRDEKYAKGLRRTGAGEKAPGGADFAGASDVAHPLLLECSIEFAANAYKELFPADGPCKTKIVGKYGEKDLDRSNRIRDFMNWQLTTEITEFEETLDETLSQVPLAGSQYVRWYWNKHRNRPAVEYISSDKLILPSAASAMFTSERITYRYTLTKNNYEQKIRDGIFREELEPTDSPIDPEQTRAERANDRIQGKKSTGLSEDGSREFYDIYCELDAPKPYGRGAYIMTIDTNSRECVQLRRNWEQEDDKQRERMDWIVEFPFVAWRGPYSLGLIHLIGDLAGAATGALRALLDSGHINNSPSALKLKGAGRVSGQTKQVNAVGVQEIEGGVGIDDIRKAIMPYPFNPPSAVLFQLLGFLVETGKGLVSTANQAIADSTNQAPVGTTLALIEQGGKVFSAIHKRLHRAAKRSLAIQYRINKMFLTEERVIKELDKLVVRPEDFKGPCTIIPVSDPNIFSEAQRVAQMQAVFQLMGLAPDLYDRREVHERTLGMLKIPDYEGLMVKDKNPEDLNPIAENMAMGHGMPAVAFPDQDQLAHIQTHVAFLEDPTLGANPVFASSYLPNAVEHIKQHIMLLYAKTCYDVASEAAGLPINQLIRKDAESRAAFDQVMAAASIKVQGIMGKALEKVMPVLQQATQTLQQIMPPPPMDPTQAAMADVKRQEAKDQGDLQLRNKEIDSKAQTEQAKTQESMAKAQGQMQKDAVEAQRTAAQAETERVKAKQEARKQALAEKKQNLDAMLAAEGQQLELNLTNRKIESDELRNHEDNQTALTIAAMRTVESKQKVGNMKQGNSMTNPNP